MLTLLILFIGGPRQIWSLTDILVGVPVGDNITLAVWILSNPQPTQFKWTFIDTDGKVHEPLSGDMTHVGDVYRLTTGVQLMINVTDDAFGVYILETSNEYGRMNTTYDLQRLGNTLLMY